jgi:hypothetical protein
VTVTDTETEAEESPAYRWTIRALYAIAIGLNVWIMVDQMNEANPTRLPIVKAKVEAWVRRTVEPLQAPGRFRAATNRVIYEATEIVENA